MVRFDHAHGDAADMKIATVSSGSLAIDKALNVGGYPRGRIVKSTVLKVREDDCRPPCRGRSSTARGTVAYIDAENALDPQYAEALGVVDNCSYPSQTPVKRDWQSRMP